jgi:hypothetical protein
MRKLIKTTLKAFGLIVSLGLIGVVALIGYFWLTAEPMCGNDLLTSTEIEGTGLKIVTFQRDCGATTGFSTQVSIIPAKDQLPNEEGNIFTGDTNHGAAPSGQGGGPEVRVRILGPKEVQLSYHPKTRVFRAETGFKQVKITYSTF